MRGKRSIPPAYWEHGYQKWAMKDTIRRATAFVRRLDKQRQQRLQSGRNGSNLAGATEPDTSMPVPGASQKGQR